MQLNQDRVCETRKRGSFGNLSSFGPTAAPLACPDLIMPISDDKAPATKRLRLDVSQSSGVLSHEVDPNGQLYNSIRFALSSDLQLAFPLNQQLHCCRRIISSCTNPRQLRLFTRTVKCVDYNSMMTSSNVNCILSIASLGAVASVGNRSHSQSHLIDT